MYHESSVFHVTGEAIYIDDIQFDNRLLNGYIYTSPFSHAKIISFDIEDAKKISGIQAILSAKDIPGQNQMGPVFHDEFVLAENEVTFIGQAIFLIAAENEQAAIQAKNAIKIEFEEIPSIITIEEAILKGELLQPERKIEAGNIEKGFTEADHIIEGELKTGAQEHWYLETQISVCLPGEGSEMKIFASSQNPTETQILVAEVLGIDFHHVEVETKRLGGGFGGKETQGNHVAVWAALLANATKHPVKVRLFRDDDQKMTGKRHPFLINYKAGFNNEGKIIAADISLHANGGAATDLSMAILERSMLHAENAYFIPNIRIIGKAWKTNLASNTAFRGFGGPQGMAGIETIIDRIARYLKKDAAEIRKLNFYQKNHTTPYGQSIDENRLEKIYNSIIESSKYKQRRKEIQDYNQKSEFYKKGIALTPVKFGISFTTSFLNQAGALVNIYTDGTVLVNHGGTEMGQGLNTKIQQITSFELGIPIEKVKVNATNTTKVPNTSPTAASSGTDMNGMAVKNAITKIKRRINAVLINEFNKNNPKNPTFEEDIIYSHNTIFDKKNPERKFDFNKAMNFVRVNQRSLSATGYYKTPGVYFDRSIGKGNPFYYYAYGMSVSEILLDVLTGQVKVLQVDILHDAGNSINKEIDKGQIEGGFIQGLGWCILEECKWNSKGLLLNSSPDTYKIPTFDDIPQIFHVNLLENTPNNKETILKSKAVGEPPFMLALSVWLAVKDAISSVKNHTIEPDFAIPATHEANLLSIEKLKSIK